MQTEWFSSDEFTWRDGIGRVNKMKMTEDKNEPVPEWFQVISEKSGEVKKFFLSESGNHFWSYKTEDGYEILVLED
jgi:hypothetical protein